MRVERHGGVRRASIAVVTAAVAAGCIPSPPKPGETEPPPSDEIIIGIDAGEARDALTDALGAAERLNAVCGDLEAWTSAGAEAAEVVTAAAEAVAADESLEGWTGLVESRQLAHAFRDLLVFQSECDGGDAEPRAAAIDEAVVVAGRLTAATEVLWLALTETDAPDRGTQIWFHPDQFAHLVEGSRLLSAGDIDVLMVGGAAAARAFDPLALTESTGDTFLNASVSSLLPETTAGWLTMLEGIGVRPRTVVIAVTPWVDASPCSRTVTNRARRAFSAADEAFASVPGLGDVPPALRLIGGTDGDPGGPIAEQADRRWETRAQGRLAIVDVELDADALSRQREAYTKRFRDSEPCPGRSAAVEAVAESLGERGIEVVLVVMPVSNGMNELLPGGDEGVAELVSAYGEMSDRLGLEVIDLSDALTDAGFANPVQVNAEGREQIAAALAAELRGT